MRKGSITPFCALSLMLVASLLFALLESARFCGLERYAEMKADTAIDSVCAEYQPYLWQQYGLLFLDGAYGTEQFSMGYVIEQLGRYMELNCEVTDWPDNWMGVDLFRMKKGETLLEGYALATDDNGDLFLHYVAQREKENLPLGVAEDLFAQYQKANALETEYGDAEASVTKAKDAVVEAKSEWIARQEEELEKCENKKEADVQIEAPDTSKVDNLLDSVQQMQNSGTLNMIFGETSDISAKACRLNEDMDTREKEGGTMYLKTDKDWYQKLLVMSYLGEYFSNYTDPKETHLLCYEMEYVLCGSDTEWENLDGTLARLLLMRTAANVAYLLSDKEKMAQAEEAAGLIGLLAGGNYGAVKAVQIGIVGAWAYAESVLDVRALVQGEVIPLVKQYAEWTTDMDEIFSVFDKNLKAKVCTNGLSYTDYLKQLLFLMDNQELAYRMMEVMELGMQSEEAYENCRMDHMIIMFRFKLTFESKPIFSRLLSGEEVHRGNYIFAREIERSYVP